MTGAAGSVSVRRLARALGAGWWIAPAIALALAAAGCAEIAGQPVAGAPAGTTVVKLTGFRPAATPPDPSTASPSAIELEASLRRIVVSYSQFTALFRTPPQPLLSEQQIGSYAQILARELPSLSDAQRLEFKFTDRYFGRGYDVIFDVYREGTYLVYWFKALASGAITSGAAGEVVFMARLEQAAPGQEVANRNTYAYVKDPLLGEQRALAAEQESKRQQFEQARKEGDFEPDEAERLMAIMSRPQPDAAAWKSYWDRRRTLKAALEQGLMDRAAYNAQVDRLNGELEKSGK